MLRTKKWKSGDQTSADWPTDLGSPSPCGPAMCEWTDIISGILSWLHSAENFLCMTEWFHYETRHILGAESLSHSWVDTGYEEGTGGPERRLEELWQYQGWTARLWCAWRAGTKPGFAQTTGESVRTRTFGHSLSKTEIGFHSSAHKRRNIFAKCHDHLCYSLQVQVLDFVHISSPAVILVCRPGNITMDTKICSSLPSGFTLKDFKL